MDALKNFNFKNLKKEEIDKEVFTQISLLLNKGQYNTAEKKVKELPIDLIPSDVIVIGSGDIFIGITLSTTILLGKELITCL